MVLGYDQVVESSTAEEMFKGRSLPVITNNERVVSGEDIKPYLKELEKLMHDWRCFRVIIVMSMTWELLVKLKTAREVNSRAVLF